VILYESLYIFPGNVWVLRFAILVLVSDGTLLLMSLLVDWLTKELKGSVKEPNKFHIYETEKITRKASDVAEYIKLFGSFTGDRRI